MELALKTQVLPGQIDNNLDAFIAEVKKQVASYQGLVFEDDDIKNAKSTVAELRKYRSDIEDRRKQTKKDWNKPYEAFESKVKEAVKAIDETIDPIATQIAEAEEKRKQEKKDAIIEIKAKLCEGSIADEFIHSCSWFDDPRWLNATVSLRKVEEQILEKKAQVEEGLQVIQSTGGDHVSMLLEEYRKSGDVSKTLLYRDELVRRDEQARELAERMKQQLNQHTPEPTYQPEEAPASEGPREAPRQEQASQERLIQITFQVSATKPQLLALRSFCDEQGIQIRRA